MAGSAKKGAGKMTIFEELVKKRGIDAEFLQPKYVECGGKARLGGGMLPDVRVAAERIAKAAERGEKVMIYGDYDVDGVTASTLMYDTLKLCGVKEVMMMLPDRFVDGYGMSERCIERAEAEGVGLVITVDCGSNNEAVILGLAEKGMETIVTDHHELSGKVPEKAVAVVNPKRTDIECEPALRDLSGVGVAFMVARELVRLGKIEKGQEKWLLDLVVIGTLCDSMPMTRVNRMLCYYGMKVLEKTRRVGLVELMKSAGVRQMTADAVGFLIGPRLNAAGRMETAETALKLLMTRSRAEAVRLVGELERLNKERKTQQSAAVREVAERGVGNEPVIVVVGKWHEGILGIIAGRLVEKYKRPAFVLAETEPGVLKGSGRSFGDFNLAEALVECQDYIVGGGGHAGACGVKVLMDKWKEFERAINEYYQSLRLKDQERFLDCVEDVTVKDLGALTLSLIDELAQLEPYGEGNSEPVFLISQAKVLEVAKMGSEQQHLRVTLADADGRRLKLVAFYAPQEWMGVPEGGLVDAWVTLMRNEWNGYTNVEGRISDLRVVI